MFMNENNRKCAFHECSGFTVMSNFVLDIFFKTHWKIYITED